MKSFWGGAGLAVASPLVLFGAAAGAQDRETPAPGAAPAVTLPTVTVTGSNIRRTDAETPSPVQVLSAEDLRRSGYTSVQDVLHNITANGQGTLSQSFSGGFASGAAGIALRGLAVGSTLVLIDGRRMAPYPRGDDATRSFVDIANIPFDAVERIEVLKDGASAVYGSDAIAGVVNIILKRSFAGIRLSADTGTSYKNDGTSYKVAGIAGFGDLASDGHTAYVAVELRKQNQIRLTDREGVFTRTDFTADGGYDLTPGVPAPGNPFVGGLPASATGYVADATGAIAGFMPGCDAARLAASRCSYHGNWAQIQPSTENDNLVMRYTQRVAPDWQIVLQGSYFRSRSQQVFDPSRSFANGYQGVTSGPGVVPVILPALAPTTIPATNPSFPAGTGLRSGVLHYTFLDLGPRVTDSDARATRLIADVQGRLGPWDLTASLGHTQVLLTLLGRNHVNPVRLQAALDSTSDPYLVGQDNTASVKSFIAPVLRADDRSTLDFVHLGGARELMALPGGPLSVALGIDQTRHRLDARAPDAVAAGLYQDFSNAFAVGRQTVRSAFVELAAPLTRTIEVDGAVRYDHYDAAGGKASPKLGIKYRPIPELALRATASRGFRAPGIGESGNAGATAGSGTQNDPILCPNPSNPRAPGSFPSQCNLEFGLIFGANPALKPETSKAFTLGLIVEPIQGLSATLDFYSIEVSNQIVAGTVQTPVRGSNFAPLEQVQPDGSTLLVVPPVAPIAYATVPYVNANSTKTSGFDLGVRYRHRFEGVGTFESELTLSHTAKYDLTIDGTTYHLAGTHAPLVVSGDTGNPRTRAQWVNGLSRGPWQVTGTVNYISSFGVTDPSLGLNTCVDALAAFGAASSPFQRVLAQGTVPFGVSCRVRSFTTFDLYGRFDINQRLSVHASVINLFNASAPLDWTTYGGDRGNVPWNPSFHLQGAVGRYFNVGATYTF